MAVTDVRQSSTDTAYEATRSGQWNRHLVYVELDFDTNNITATATHIFLTVPANAYIHSVMAQTTATETGNIDIGVYSSAANATVVDADMFIDAHGLSSVASISYTAASPTQKAGRWWGATRYLGVTSSAALDAAKVNVWVDMSLLNTV